MTPAAQNHEQWLNEVCEAAKAAAADAYCPYSDFAVGAAVLAEDGRIFSGCNVENASYGLTLCAECGLVSALRLAGGDAFVAVGCVDGDGRTLTPCGRCRQILMEHGGSEMLVDAQPEPARLGSLLPGAFELDTPGAPPDQERP